jgi:large conductance mechanosensitive channel
MQSETATNNDSILEELKKIRELLTPPPTPNPKGIKNQFLTFLAQYKVLGLAVAFIIGLYLGLVVADLATDLILPGIGVLFPGLGNLATYSPTYHNQVFGVGPFIAAVLTFIIIAFVIFLIVKAATSWGLNK